MGISIVSFKVDLKLLLLQLVTAKIMKLLLFEHIS